MRQSNVMSLDWDSALLCAGLPLEGSRDREEGAERHGDIEELTSASQ